VAIVIAKGARGRRMLLCFGISNLPSRGRCSLKNPLLGLAAFAMIVLSVGSTKAQSNESDLAKQLANPVSSVVSVPFQSITIAALARRMCPVTCSISSRSFEYR